MNIFRNTLRTVALCLMTIALTGCDLLYTESQEKLSGSEFWDGANSSDVRSFVNSIYSSLRKATMQDAAFFLLAGDMRCAPIDTKLDKTRNDGKYVVALSTNDLNLLRQTYTDDGDYRSAKWIMDWQEMYEVVQSANILIKEVDRASISDAEKQAFRDEGIFARCLAYFLLVRNFGAVPYYTNAYNAAPLPRTDMVTVLKNISAELQQVLDSDPDGNILPMTRTGSDKGVKASRGAVLALMMHVNMWLAGFDEANAQAYYQKVVDCGAELVDNNGGSYSLVPITQMTSSLFKGASNEGIFEIVQNISYASGSETFSINSVFSNQVMYTPISGKKQANFFYPYDFMSKVYPSGQNDDRVTYWFNEYAYSTMDTYDSYREITKFKNVDSWGDNTTTNSGNYIVFRLGDAILLYAEALADLGTDDTKALELLNRIRQRANAPLMQVSGQDLKDAIYWERVRELIGEGQYFYDLVRTKRIFDSNFCWHTITKADFNNGAWTWPIDREALTNNTNIELNNFWE